MSSERLDTGRTGAGTRPVHHRVFRSLGRHFMFCYFADNPTTGEEIAAQLKATPGIGPYDPIAEVDNFATLPGSVRRQMAANELRLRLEAIG